jgi:hypothetical protein
MAVGVTLYVTDPTAPEVFTSVSLRLPIPLLPTVVPVMAPVIPPGGTVHAKLLGKEAVKLDTGIVPLHEVIVVGDVITGRGLTVTLIVASAPTQPEIAVSATRTTTGDIVLKSTLILSPAALATVAPVTVQV